MSTPAGHSRRQALQPMHRSNTSFIPGERMASGPSWPVSASRRAFARPRVTCFSSPVTRYDGHIVPGSAFRQAPLLLHISAAPASPPQRLQSRVVSKGWCAYPGR